MATEKIDYKGLVKEMRKKLIKFEKEDWKKADDFGLKNYKRGHSNCASHFIQLINDWEKGIYNEKHY